MRIIPAAVLLLLGACNPIVVTPSNFINPVPESPVSPISAPIVISRGQLDGRASFSATKEMFDEDGGLQGRTVQTTTGYIESTQIGNDVQINIVIEKIGRGSVSQRVPTLVVQMTFPNGTGDPRIRVGGALYSQANDGERKALELVSQAFVRYMVPPTSKTAINQGDIVFRFGIREILGTLNLPGFENMQGSGAGFVTRAVGETTRDGRRSYVLAVDGAENIVGPKGEAAIATSGYYIVDAATGLYSEYKMLGVVSGTFEGRKSKQYSLDKFEIRF